MAHYFCGGLLGGDPAERLVFDLVNFHFWGSHNETIGGSHSRRLLPVQLGPHAAVLRYLGPMNAYPGTHAAPYEVTAELEVVSSGVKFDDDALSALCAVASLAIGTRVDSIRRRSVDGTGSVRFERWTNTAARPFCGAMQLIPLGTPFDRTLANYIEATFPRVASAKEFGFLVALQYYLEAVLSELDAVKFLLASVAMEALKGSYRAKMGSRKGEDFRTTLHRLCTDLGLSDEEFGFINPWRNNVVHEGLTKMAPGDFTQHYLTLIAQLGRILLRLLDYSGVYVNAAADFAVERVFAGPVDSTPSDVADGT